MTKQLHLTVEEVLDDVLSEDKNFDDPDEPIMDGSDDKFSDLEIDSDDDYDPGDENLSSNGPDSTIHSGSDTPISHSPHTLPSANIDQILNTIQSLLAFTPLQILLALQTLLAQLLHHRYLPQVPRSTFRIILYVV